MSEMANTLKALQELPIGSVIRVESDAPRVNGKVLEIVDREFHRYSGINGAHYSTAWSRDLVPARVLWRPEYDRERESLGHGDD